MNILARQHALRSLITRWVTMPALDERDPVEWHAVCDDASGHYVLFLLGWDGRERVHSVALHLRLLSDGTVVEEINTTSESARDMLAAVGIPPNTLVTPEELTAVYTA